MEGFLILTTSDPIIDLPAAKGAGAAYALIRIMSTCEQGRAANIRLAEITQSQKRAAEHREYAAVYLDAINEIRIRLRIILNETLAAKESIEKYCASPMVDLQTVAEFLPKLSKHDQIITLLTKRL